MAESSKREDGRKPAIDRKESGPLSIKSGESNALIHFKTRPLLLANIPTEVAEQFLSKGMEEEYRTHEEILRKGQIGRDMFLICEGKVSVWSKGVNLALIRKGDVFGELILFRDHYRIASVRAEEPVRVLRYARSVLMDFFARQSEQTFHIYVMNIIEILRRKLIDTNRRVVELERRMLLER